MATLLTYEDLLFLWNLEYRKALNDKDGKEPSERFMQKVKNHRRNNNDR